MTPLEPITHVLQERQSDGTWLTIETFWDLMLAIASLDVYSLDGQDDTYRLMRAGDVEDHAND